MEHIIAAAECWVKHLRDMASKIELDIENYRTQRKMAAIGKATIKPAPKKRQLSADARQRIREAQAKRWAEFRKNQKTK